MSGFRTGLALALSIILIVPAQARDRLVQPNVPSNIEAPAGTKLFRVGHAIGTQNYICAPAPTASGVDWLFLGPQAIVFDEDQKQILTHFLSKNPFKNHELHATWQDSRDSSIVWAKRLDGSMDPAYVAPGAIEWLLLEMTGADNGPTGGDRLARTLFIQRVNTAGGVKPPAAECTPTTINSRRLVNYEADYYFYR
jgi:hypothetical protein